MDEQSYTQSRIGRNISPNAKHTQMISELCARDPQLQTKRFWRAVDALTEELDFFEPVRQQSFIPDAFKINHETKELEIHEVVRTHDVSNNKLRMMGSLWREFDGEQEEWYPVLFIHREGFLPRRVDLFEVYLDILREAESQFQTHSLTPTVEAV